MKTHGDVYSQARVARVIGRSQTWLSNLELGHRRLDAGALLLLAYVYDIPPEHFVREAADESEDAEMTKWMRKFRRLQRA